MSTTQHYLTTYSPTLLYTTLKVTLYTLYVLNSTGSPVKRRSLLISVMCSAQYVSQFNLPCSTPPFPPKQDLAPPLLASINSVLPYPAIKPSDSPPSPIPRSLSIPGPRLQPPPDRDSPLLPLLSDLLALLVYSSVSATPRLSTRLNCLDSSILCRTLDSLCVPTTADTSMHAHLLLHYSVSYPYFYPISTPHRAQKKSQLQWCPPRLPPATPSPSSLLCPHGCLQRA